MSRFDRITLDPELAEANRKVDEEAERFRAALPSLLERADLHGRYVVFTDGAVLRAFDEAGEGYRWAVATLGRYVGFVVTRVEPARFYRIGAAITPRREPQHRPQLEPQQRRRREQQPETTRALA